MTTTTRPSSAPASTRPSFADLFTPKLVTIFREGYGLGHLRADMIAGLTVAIVAIPLSMAIAIASGATPAQGLYTAIIGGFIISLLGGSRFQIGGPAGAFIVLVAATVQAHGMDGLIIATMLAGLMLVAAGYLRLGTYIKFIPYPVTVGFTAGIAVIIFASQLKELLGLSLTGAEPGPLVDKLMALWHAAPSASTPAIILSLATVLVIIVLKRLRPNLPVMLIAVAGSAVAVTLLGLSVETIGTKFGGIPQSLPTPALPTLTFEKVITMLPSAGAFALLGAIESLLSAVVADGMTGRSHRSNCELVAQGCANVASGLFGGICVTGTIARTATNIRAGAHGPVAGMMHALFLLLFILIAAPLASFIPLAGLAAVLAIVAWDMVEKQAFATLVRASKGDAAVLLVTFLLTIFRDLTEAIIVGFALGSLVFIYRMSKTTMIEQHMPLVAEDTADASAEDRVPYDSASATDPDMVIYRISGAFFFGAAASIASVLDRIADHHRALVIDFSAVPFVDSTAVSTIEGLARKAARGGITVYLTGASPDVAQTLRRFGHITEAVQFEPSINAATEKWRQRGE
ncbi:SulP family inorganic anion transporter [Kordiimonas lipolytica]|uniref:SulP family inorganic anion transporter n=1 Tax=Kordiimonas lipolytica TaxID=1662421 RepID=A0ABV8U933_9PROT|nr:SulP family inorganic anion transporter [Kordiimonas lipolytica]